MENNKDSFNFENKLETPEDSFIGTLEQTDRSRQDEYERFDQENNEALRLAYTDKQTGCYNRNYYEKILGDINYEKHDDNIIMIVVDVNDLGLVNNKMGYAAGDKLIDNMSRQLKNQLEISPIAQNISGNELKKGDTIIVRVGGDEFIVMRLKTEEERNDPDFETNFEEDINKRIYDNKPRNLNFAWGFTTFDKNFDEDINGTKDRAGMIMHQQKRAMKANGDTIAP